MSCTRTRQSKLKVNPSCLVGFNAFFATPVSMVWYTNQEGDMLDFDQGLGSS